VSIPRYSGDVTPEWLSAALSGHRTGVEVSGVDVVAIGTGQTGATYRVTARYATDPGDLPQTFVIKLPAGDDTVRDRVAIGYRSECAFYSSVADRVRVPTPRCFYCDITDDALNYALLLADQAPAVQGDQIAGCGEQEARLTVIALAGLHGPSWCDPYWLELPGLAFPRPDEAAAKGLGDVAKMSADITCEKLGDRMSAEDRETFSKAMGLVTPWLFAERDRFALLHGDYRRALVGYGVTGYDRDTCWRDYRLGMIHALLISALGFAFATATERGDDMVLTMLRRGCQAIRDLETLALIG